VTARSAVSTAQLVETARNPTVSLSEQHEAFTRLVEPLQHVVFGHALSFLRNVEEARDAAQETLTTAWRCLPQLRDASVFAAWLKRIAMTQCHRRTRRRALESAAAVAPDPAGTGESRSERQSLMASAVADLPAGERHVTVLYYFMGYTQEEIARLLRLKPGTVGKRLYSARMRIRRGLSPRLRREVVRLRRTGTFIEDVRRGIYDEYVGEYRFAERPDLHVSITRQGDSLVSDAGGQRNLLVCRKKGSLLTSHYDGEGRFRRNRRGAVTHFVYYEFGRRLGVARKRRAMPGMKTSVRQRGP